MTLGWFGMLLIGGGGDIEGLALGEETEKVKVGKENLQRDSG